MISINCFLVKVLVSRFSISQLAGVALLSAEAASFFAGRAILKMADVTELMLLGAFSGIHELYRMPKGVEETGLIIYLRSAVKSLGLVEMTELTDLPPRQPQNYERSFSAPKAPVLRYPSLFSPGSLILKSPNY